MCVNLVWIRRSMMTTASNVRKTSSLILELIFPSKQYLYHEENKRFNTGYNATDGPAFCRHLRSVRVKFPGQKPHRYPPGGSNVVKRTECSVAAGRPLRSAARVSTNSGVVGVHQL